MLKTDLQRIAETRWEGEGGNVPESGAAVPADESDADEDDESGDTD